MTRMPDLIALYAKAHPDKLAVIDDRPAGPDRAAEIRTFTYAQLDGAANQFANVLADRGVGPGSKLVWCGQNSIGIVTVITAAAKLGVTAVPLNYRLADEEAAFVTDHSDATLVVVDAEFAPMFARIRARIPKVTSVLVFDGPPPDGGDGWFASGDELAAVAATTPPPAGAADNAADDDLHVRHHRQAEGRGAQPARGDGAGRGDGRSSSATRPTTSTSRPVRSTTPVPVVSWRSPRRSARPS